MDRESSFVLSRRGALGAMGGAVALGLASKAFAQSTSSDAGQSTSSDAGQSTDIVLRGGYVLTMDPALGDLEVGDVHIRDGAIVEIAPEISAPGATEIDARNTVVMPGFVDTHWHMWNSTWRGMANDASAYFALRGLGAVYTPEDHYAALRYAALDAINAGFTTTHNWAHGVNSVEDAQAELQALLDIGIRAKLGLPALLAGVPTTREQIQGLLDWIAQNGEGRLGLGMILDGAGDALAERVKLARDLNLRPITDHSGAIAHPDLLGPEMLYTHGTDVTPEQIAVIIETGIGVALCPGTDPMIGAGLPPIHPLLAGGVPLAQISMTVDVTAQTPTDPFSMLRTIVNAGRIQQANNTNLRAVAQAAPDWALSYRDALAIGTSSGANVLGLGDQVGTLSVGKRADIITVRMDAINMMPAPNTNKTYLMVQNGLPSNVDTVIVDGRIRKQAGALVGVDVAEVVAQAAASQEAIRQRAKLPPLDTSL